MSKARARHMEVTRDRKRGRLVTRDVPKERTIRAWAVVCASGKRHGNRYSGGPEWDRSDAVKQRDGYNDRYSTGEPVYPCGPHTVVALSGVWKGKESR